MFSPMYQPEKWNGIQTVSAAQGVNFDLNATGHNDKWGWVGGNDGLLVMDRNGNGSIDSGAELFGAGTTVNGRKGLDGFAALASLDTNHDGHINAKDVDFSKLQVWVDANHDGKTDAGELKTLADLGITDLNLGATKGTDVDHGNVLGLVSSFTKSDGTSHEMTDVWFAKDGSQHTATNATAATPHLGDLLAQPEANLLGGATASTATAVTAATTAAATDTVNHDVMSAAYKKLHEDDQNGAAPLI